MQRSKVVRVLVLLVVLGLAGCGAPPPDPIGWQAPVAAETGCIEPGLPGPGASGPGVPAAVFNTSFGVMRFRLEVEAVPVTAGNFMDLARDGFYDGTRFHHAVQGFAMQGGDPLSRDDNPDNDGAGGPGYTIPDEFHHALRHDAAGVLSMAHHGPGTAGSQFLVTFAAQPHLDDRHAVFGRITSGQDVLARIEAEAADPVDDRGAPVHGGVPREDIVLRSVHIEVPSQARPEPEAGSLGLFAPDAVQQVGAAGGQAAFVVVAVSCRPWRTDLAIASAVDLEVGFGAFVIPAHQRVAFLVTGDVPGGPPATVTWPVTLVHAGGEVGLELRVERREADARPAEHIQYIAMLADGRIADASSPVEGPVFGTCCAQRGPHAPSQDSLLPLRVLAEKVAVGTSAAMRATPDEAYRGGILEGRTMLFLVEGA